MLANTDTNTTTDNVVSTTTDNTNDNTDLLAIKDSQINDLKNQVIDLKKQNALLQNQITNLEIDLATAKSMVDAQSTTDNTDNVDNDVYMSDEDAIKAIVAKTVKGEL